MAGYLLGIDASTTATKALLIDSMGKVIAVAATEYGFDTPHPLWSEQDPALWWFAAVQSIRQLLAETAIDAGANSRCGLTGQMHGLTLLDEEGGVLRPAILWNDQRTAQQCDEIRAMRWAKSSWCRMTGNDALTGFTAARNFVGAGE